MHVSFRASKRQWVAELLELSTEGLLLSQNARWLPRHRMTASDRNVSPLALSLSNSLTLSLSLRWRRAPRRCTPP